jgi:hypothetical protein
MFYTKGGFQGDSGFLDECSQSPFNSPFNWRTFTFMANISIKGGRALNNDTTYVGSIITGSKIPGYISISKYEAGDNNNLSKGKNR